MKSAWLGLSLLVFASAAFPDTLPDILAAASSANAVSVSLALDMELARLRLEKSRIEARRERDSLSAELTFITAQETGRRALLEFCNEVIDSVFDVAAAEVDARIAALSESSAREEQLGAQRQHERGLVSDEDRSNAAIALGSARLALEQAGWALEDAREQLRMQTGLEWRASLVPELPDFTPSVDSGAWTASDLSLRKAEISERVAALDVAALPGNVAPYDRRIADAALRKAQMALEQAGRTSERSLRSALQTLESRRATIAIRQGEMDMQASLLDDAERRYSKGAISRGERDRQQIRLWTAEKARLQALRGYLLAVVSHLVATGADPKEAL